MVGCAVAVMLTLSCTKAKIDHLFDDSYYFEFTMGGQEYKMDVSLLAEDDQAQGASHYQVEIGGHNGLTGEKRMVAAVRIRLPLDKVDNPVGEYRVGNYRSSSPLYPGSADMEIYNGKPADTHGGSPDTQVGTVTITDFARGDGGEGSQFKELMGTVELDIFEYDAEKGTQLPDPTAVKGKFHVRNVDTYNPH